MEGKGLQRRRSRTSTRRETHARLRDHSWLRRFERGRRWLSMPANFLPALAIALACFTSLPLLRYCTNHRYFEVREVVVVGARRLSPAVVEGWLGLVEEGRSIWRIEPAALEQRLRARPEIAEAQVDRLLPDRLRVSIEERQAVALLRVDDAFHLVTGEGSVIGRVDDPDPALPIVTLAASGTDEDALPRRADLRQVLTLAQELDQGAAGVEISEVALATSGPTPEVTLYSEDGQLRIDLGWQDFKGKLALLRRMAEGGAFEPGAGASARQGAIELLDGQTAVVRWKTPAPPGAGVRRAA